MSNITTIFQDAATILGALVVICGAVAAILGVFQNRVHSAKLGTVIADVAKVSELAATAAADVAAVKGALPASLAVPQTPSVPPRPSPTAA